MLRRESRGEMLWLTLDRPDKLNALPRSFWAELTAAASEIALDHQVRAVILSGNGRAFSVGGDIRDFAEIGGPEDRRAYMDEALGAYRALDGLPKPVIAAVHGHAMGGGCELTMVCDVVVADETARFGTPEAAVGLVPGPGSVRGLAHANLHWMKYLVLSGESIDAEEARLAGLVNFVVPAGQHLAEAERIATIMASRSPDAQARGKAYLNQGGWERDQEAADMVVALQGGADFREGIDAFSARRPAVFRARGG